MIKATCVIVNKAGLHARSSAKLVDIATQFSSSVRLSVGGKVVDGKSILALMMLAATQGTEVTLEVDGSDEAPAIAALTDLIERGFDEES